MKGKPSIVAYFLILIFPFVTGGGTAVLPDISSIWIGIWLFSLLLLIAWIVLGNIIGSFEKLTHRFIFIISSINIGVFYALAIVWRISGEVIWLGIVSVILYISSIVLGYKYRKSICLTLYADLSSRGEKEKDSLLSIAILFIAGAIVSFTGGGSIPGSILFVCSLLISTFFSAFYYRAELMISSKEDNNVH
ncbi:hypothetical protein [Desmospora profundinema]|uniref:Uncharacterized protein n=1 Tax=Desmospora profundinema TaxID=1571184 RepID=A0ABU1ISY0_9BACL|nr:hypothetical protein [Desmospora profundinema]MDR6227039.1 hypothetical protein [Desmospora profundinema]